MINFIKKNKVKLISSLIGISIVITLSIIIVIITNIIK